MHASKVFVNSLFFAAPFSRTRCFSQRNRANTVGQFANYEILRGRAWAPAITETRPTAGTLAESGEYCVDALAPENGKHRAAVCELCMFGGALALRNTLYHANHGHTSSMNISCVATLHEVSAPGIFPSNITRDPRGPPARRSGHSLTSWKTLLAERV